MEEHGRARYVIVGGGLTAAKAVEGIRQEDPYGEITVVTEEQHLPYERPPLSKSVLLGKDSPDTAFPHPQAWYDQEVVGLRLGDPAVEIAHREVILRSGARLDFDRLLLATGSTVRQLKVPGAELDGVCYLRSLDDSLTLRERLKTGGDVVVVGAGWIGLEVAAAAREHGCRVTIVEPQTAPLLGVMGERIGGWFADLHRAHGVDLRPGTGVAGFAGKGTVAGVLTDGGVTIPADTVVVGVGIQPHTGLAAAAGVKIDNGVVTDAALRTSVEGIWAAGDVANWYSTLLGRHLRVEHWANAHDGGLAAGRSMAGADVTYDPVPFFFSDQYDIGLEYAGSVPREATAELIVRGALSSDAFMAFWVERSQAGVRVLAGMHVNTWDTMDAVQALIRQGSLLDPARLADPEVPLDDLLS